MPRWGHDILTLRQHAHGVEGNNIEHSSWFNVYGFEFRKNNGSYTVSANTGTATIESKLTDEGTTSSNSFVRLHL